MITHHNGLRYSVSYTVEDVLSGNSIVISGINELTNQLGFTREEAYALLHGECRIKGYMLTRQDEVEI